MRLLELFSGTHSIGVICKEKNIDVVSLDRDLDAKSKLYDYESGHHIKTDIMTWDYKADFKEGDFDIITASPVCLFWSSLRNTWIGRKSKSINPNGDVVTMEHIERDIELYGKPMVDKCFEIIEYFKPKYWWIENPKTGKMKRYIESDYPQYNNFYDVDYCKYSNWGYQKRTRFWTNIADFIPKICKKDCDNIMIVTEKQKMHKNNLACNDKVNINGKVINCNTKELKIKYRKEKHNTKKYMPGSGSNRLERYRVPFPLIQDLLNCCVESLP